MKFLVNKSLFEESLNIVERAISNRNTLPVLNNVLLSIENKKLTLITTNLETAIKTTIEVENSEDGKITIPVKLLSNYISLLKSEKVEIELTNKDTLSLKTEETETTIKGISSEEFPLIPKIETTQKTELLVEDFIKNVSKIVFASALDELRPVLAGVFLKVENKIMTTVATDSYRLVEMKKEIENDNNFSIIIPSKTVLELSRIFNKGKDKKIKIEISKNQIKFQCEEIELTSRLIEGQYPDYTKIIPKEINTKAEVETQELITAIKRASLFAKENSNSIKIEIKKDEINIIVDSVQTGSEKARIKAKTEGEEKTIAFNAQYLIDAISNITTDQVEIGVNSSITPGLIKPKNEKGCIHVVMPLKV